jgi:glycosyltransferase involved in cell wall biosynthesis
MKDNKFVFVVPVYNASKTLGQMLLSVVAQSYKNFKVVMIDDISDTSEKFLQRSIIDKMREFVNPDQLVYVENEEKKWEVKNVLTGIAEHSDNPEDVIARLDGDDWLSDLDILHILNQKYNEHKVDAIWTAHRWEFTDFNISRRLPNCSDVYQENWVSSHFKTFRRKLLDNVPHDNFLNSDGVYVRRAGDQAIYLPALHNAKGNWHFEPRVAYHYTIDTRPETFQTDDAKFQKNEAEFLRKRGYVKNGEPWEKYFKGDK